MEERPQERNVILDSIERVLTQTGTFEKRFDGYVFLRAVDVFSTGWSVSRGMRRETGGGGVGAGSTRKPFRGMEEGEGGRGKGEGRDGETEREEEREGGGGDDLLG